MYFNTSRKRRGTGVTILPEHIVIVVGYPKDLGNGEVQVLYTILIPVKQNKNSVMNVKTILDGAENSKTLINKMLKSKFIVATKHEESTTTSTKDSSDNSAIIIG